MTENNANEHTCSLPPSVRSNAPEEVSEPVEEPDQRRQDRHMQCLLRNEKIRLVIIGVALLAMILSYLFFRLTGNVLPLFVTIVVVYLFYRWLDAYLDRAALLPLHTSKAEGRSSRTWSRYPS